MLALCFTSVYADDESNWAREDKPYKKEISKYGPAPAMRVGAGFKMKVLLSNEALIKKMGGRTTTIHPKFKADGKGSFYFLAQWRRIYNDTPFGWTHHTAGFSFALMKWNEISGLEIIDKWIPMYSPSSIAFMQTDAYQCPKGSPVVFGVHRVYKKMRIHEKYKAVRMDPHNPDLRALCYGVDKKGRPVKQWVWQSPMEEKIYQMNDVAQLPNGKFWVFGGKTVPSIKVFYPDGKAKVNPYSMYIKAAWEIALPSNTVKWKFGNSSMPKFLQPNWEYQLADGGKTFWGLSSRIGSLHYCREVTGKDKPHMKNPEAPIMCIQYPKAFGAYSALHLKSKRELIVGLTTVIHGKKAPDRGRVEVWQLLEGKGMNRELLKKPVSAIVPGTRTVILENVFSPIGISSYKNGYIVALTNPRRRHQNMLVHVTPDK
jgi:hypothetical protein